MKIISKEVVIPFILMVRDVTILAGALLLVVTIGVLGVGVVYCWHEWIVKLPHLFHHR